MFYVIGDRLGKLGESQELPSPETEVFANDVGLTCFGRLFAMYIPTVLPLQVSYTDVGLLIAVDVRPPWLSIFKKSADVIFFFAFCLSDF